MSTVRMEDVTVRPDAKGRITLGPFAKGVSSFKIHKENDGRLTLEPYTEIPARERWVFENAEVLNSIKRGLKQSKDRKLVEFTDFVTIDEKQHT